MFVSISFFEKCLFSYLAHFLIGSFIFLVLSCMSCLYIFEINYFSVASFAIIFSHSEGCLFTLLIVSFVVQKLLSLIRSHLFIFAIRVFSNESALRIRWPKYWSFSISSSILGTYRPGEFIFQCPIFLSFHTVHGVLKARILKWFAIPFSSAHILSDLSTMTPLSWVAPHGMA